MAPTSAPPQLLDLTAGQLTTLVVQQGLQAPARATKLELLNLMVGSLTPVQLEEAAGEYLYAGKTSVAWVEFRDASNARPSISLATFTKAVTQVCGADPFTKALQPALSSTPELTEARAWHNNKVAMTFTATGNERLVFQGYQLREISEDVSFPAIFRLSDGILEIRSSHLHVQRLKDFVSSLAAALECTADHLPIDKSQFAALREALAASLFEYTGLDNSPSPYRTRAVSKKPSCPDLATDTTFQADYGGLDPVQGDLHFTGAGGEDAKASVAIRSSSVYFRSATPEATIDLVYAALLPGWP